jgi:MFS superfamily sulfate permease-like transporter
VGGSLIYMAIRKVNHMATLPFCIMLELIVFYVVLHFTHTSVQDATTNGWIRSTNTPTDSSTTNSSDMVGSMDRTETPPQQLWYHTWDYIIQFDQIDWNVLPLLWPNLVGMIFVVALSSSLDVSAIEIELRRPLDYNHELQMIGWSNIISGSTGGYTGSYIFSQSIFSLRAGINSRLAGFVLAFCELLIFVSI